jgi:hypothetical protein
VAQAVADVGDDAVEIDDRQRPGLVRHVTTGSHVAHSRSTTTKRPRSSSSSTSATVPQRS